MSNFGTTDFDYQVALGEVAGWTTGNVLGHNLNIPVGTVVLAPFGGVWTPLLAEETMSVVSTSANDVAAGSGATQVLIEGVDGTYAHVSEVVVLNGLTPVVTTQAFIAINRVVVTGSGATLTNEGAITVTSSSSVTLESQIDISDGVAHTAIYTSSNDGSVLIRSLHLNAVSIGGAAAVITFKGWVYSNISGSKYEVFRHILDTGATTYAAYESIIPFPIGPSSSFWLEATSDKASTEAFARVGLVEYDT